MVIGLVYFKNRVFLRRGYGLKASGRNVKLLKQNISPGFEGLFAQRFENINGFHGKLYQLIFRRQWPCAVFDVQHLLNCPLNKNDCTDISKLQLINLTFQAKS